MYWIVEKRDDAIMGYVNGIQTQTTMAGPFTDYEYALRIKSNEYRRAGAYYYTIVESDTKPRDTRSQYEFVDADREFDDV